MPNASGNILARWQTSLENIACSPLEFYELVECFLIASELPNLTFSQITRNEGGWFSPRRVYLRIRYQKLYFDVSAFVAGNALIASWWLHEDAPDVTDLLAEIPGFGFLMEKTRRAATYYKVDFIEYFQRTVHASVLQTVDKLSEENGLAYLPDKARVPVWEEIW